MQSFMIILAKILFNFKQNWNKPIIKMNFFKFHALMQSFMTILANIFISYRLCIQFQAKLDKINA